MFIKLKDSLFVNVNDCSYFTKPINRSQHGVYVQPVNGKASILASPFRSTDEAEQWLDKFFKKVSISVGRLPDVPTETET